MFTLILLNHYSVLCVEQTLAKKIRAYSSGLLLVPFCSSATPLGEERQHYGNVNDTSDTIKMGNHFAVLTVRGSARFSSEISSISLAAVPG